MSNLAEELPKEQARVRAIRDQYIECRGMPQVNVEPAIAMMDASLRYAEEAAAAGDIVKMLMALENLKTYEG